MEMNERQALQIIEEMISATKEEVKDNGFYYMLWGWLVFVAAFTDYFMIFSPLSEYHAVVWAVMMPAGGIASFIAGRREAKQARVKTYIHESINALTTAFVISLVIVCVIMPMTTNNWRSFFPTLMVIYAFAIFTFGGMLRYKPLKYGAAANWAFGIAAFFFGYDIQLLFLAAAVLCGFIIPGHLLKRRYDKHV